MLRKNYARLEEEEEVSVPFWSPRTKKLALGLFVATVAVVAIVASCGLAGIPALVAAAAVFTQAAILQVGAAVVIAGIVAFSATAAAVYAGVCLVAAKALTSMASFFKSIFSNTNQQKPKPQVFSSVPSKLPEQQVRKNDIEEKGIGLGLIRSSAPAPSLSAPDPVVVTEFKPSHVVILKEIGFVELTPAQKAMKEEQYELAVEKLKAKKVKEAELNAQLQYYRLEVQKDHKDHDQAIDHSRYPDLLEASYIAAKQTPTPRLH